MTAHLNKVKMKSGTQDLQGGIASSTDIFSNLSLSSYIEMEPSQNSSIGSSVISDALLKPQSKTLDPMEGGHFNTGPTADESNGETSSASSQNAAKSGIADVHGEEIQKDSFPALSLQEKADTKKSHKCSKVFDGICNDLTVFLTHLATGELQTIKGSDLEYIKELGLGTFGTVSCGKCKGFDVAIKRIKPSCFTEDSVQGDQLVSDFWREAHMLGQLHHPNIMAFYGVVTDGPITNLATVTEYMVNGSLKQVLQRKDRKF